MTRETETTGAQPPAEDDRASLWGSFDDSTPAADADEDAPPADEAAGADEDARAQTSEDEGQPSAEEPPAQDAAGAGDGDGEPDWSRVPEPLRAEHEKLQASLEQERKRHGGRVSSLERRIQEQQAELERLRAASQPPRDDAARQDEGGGKGGDDDLADLERLKEDYPEIAGPILKRLEAMQQLTDGLLSTEESRQTAVLEANEAEVMDKHPDFSDLMQERGQDFRDWIETDAPAWAVKAYQANHEAFVDPAGAVRTIEAFKAHLGLDKPTDPAPPGQGRETRSDERRRRQLRAGTSPSSSSPSAASGIPRDGDRATIWRGLEGMDEGR